MDTLIKWISTLAPFLATYPPFVKVIFSAWVLLTAVGLICLVLAKPGSAVKESEDKNETAAVTQAQAPAAPGGRSDVPKDVWMIIDGSEFFAAREGAQVRVIADVNGTELTYPSRAGVEWLEVGPSMSSQLFKLPPTKERYLIRFKADVRVPVRHGEPITGQLTSVKEDVINLATDLPFNGRYVLHTFDPIHRARSADADAQLSYRLTYDPK